MILLFLGSCTSVPSPVERPTQPVNNQTSVTTTEQPAPPAPTPTPVPPKVLTICMGSEPDSLFLYGDASIAARSVREAIFDGPFDILGFKASPVILTREPDVKNGDTVVESVEVQTGTTIVDANGDLNTLKEGVLYRPSGCNEASCAETYGGEEPVAMDQLAVRFRLRPGLQWSDGAPLTADDSLYSYQVARSLYPQARADLLDHTQSYTVVDPATVEWRAVPGYLDSSYPTNFFTPLPRHAWGSLPAQDLLTADISARRPLGWGPYRIDEWTPGDHISLSKNPLYFRAGEGLPHFDNLVFRFVSSGDQALSALLAGECDFVDESARLESQEEQLLQYQQAGKIAVAVETGSSWEHADFGILSLDSGDQASLFQDKQTRQAIAACIDRQRMADELFFGKSQVLDTYVPPEHPMYNPDTAHYSFDPQAASDLLQSAGWIDADNDPATPRVAQGVAGVPNGTPFTFTFLTTGDQEKQQAAEILRSSLAQCGISVNVKTQAWNELLAPGPDGPVFGRHFQMAQFAWITSLEPPCFLYTTQEIPGPYPEFTKGWGGANVSGYSNPDFDKACAQARFSLPDTPEHQQAEMQAQAIFAEDLPAIPLYLRVKLIAMRPDFCGVSADPSAESVLWNLESFNYGEDCTP